MHSPPSFMETPKGFDVMSEPSDNVHTEERWALGKRLFFDPVMSLDSTVSCASCHDPALAFSDASVFSTGVGGIMGRRNTPTLANVGYHPYFTREGAVPTLEMQVLIPIQEHDEFDFNIIKLAERLAADSSYVSMALAAYDRSPDPFVITRSLATFERSIISGYSRYDHHLHHDDKSALNRSELNGMELFFSDKTNCSQCHDGFNFTNYAFENNGLYETYEDSGRFQFSGESSDVARFKVPTLRNIELTAPYMHDGSMATLREVLVHYDSGGKNHPHKSPLIKSLDLTEKEMEDLEAFLIALTDDSFVNNPLFNR